MDEWGDKRKEEQIYESQYWCSIGSGQDEKKQTDCFGYVNDKRKQKQYHHYECHKNKLNGKEEKKD